MLARTVSLRNLTITLWHLSRWLHRSGLRPLARIVKMINLLVFSANLEPEADVAITAHLGHMGIGTTVHGSTIIKDGVVIWQQVTIGSVDHKREGGSGVTLERERRGRRARDRARAARAADHDRRGCSDRRRRDRAHRCAGGRRRHSDALPHRRAPACSQRLTRALRPPARRWWPAPPRPGCGRRAWPRRARRRRPRPGATEARVPRRAARHRS